MITAKAELDSMPLYVKAGAIVPIGPVKQHASEKSNEPITLQVYPGADGSFRWYDDDGISFAYELGEFMLVHCEWNDRKHALNLQRDPAGTLGRGQQVRIKLAATNTARTLTLPDRESTTEF